MIQHQLESRIFRMLSDFERMLTEHKEQVQLFTIDDNGAATEIQNGSAWGDNPWQNFQVRLKVGEAAEGYRNYLYISTGREGQWDACNPQFEARVNGKIVQAFDVNHVRMPLDTCGEITVDLEGYCCGSEMKKSRPYIQAELRCINLELEQLIYDIRVPYEAAILLQPGERDREVTLQTLSDAVDLLDLRMPHSADFNLSIHESREYLRVNYYEKRKTLPPIAVADSVGHTHIDVAWLWDIEQSRHKAVRSFSTVCKLMEAYPEYRFMSSQPVLYEFVKQDEPELYERIKDFIAQGRWEVEGGMWVEADCNLSSGESLARQFLYGQKFFKEEFGKRCTVLWLPDVFGYSAALPQIMKLSGIDYFMTTKISWNEYNTMPYDTFMWKGIDGTAVLTHFSPSRDYYSTNIGNGHHRHSDHYTTYTSVMNPSEIAGGWKRFMQKGLDDHFLVLYGYGDGGGGPTESMLEQARRMKVSLPETPVVEQEFSRPFFEKLQQRVGENPHLPVWSGELYLEYHRGTYTSQARNKLNNRKAEIALRSAELRCVQSGISPKSDLDDIWKDVLTLQFHDILPGSSIHKVYEDSDRIYADCFKKLENILIDAQTKLNEKDDDSLCIYNDLDFERDDIVRFNTDKNVGSLVDENGNHHPVQKTEEGYISYVRNLKCFAANNFTYSQDTCTAPEIRVDRYGFDTPFYKGGFDECMNIVSLFDKRAGRELCREGKALNRLVCYENKPHNYDAWDINIYYDRKSWDIDDVESVEDIISGGVAAGIRINRRFMSSTVSQDIIFYAESPRIDFRTYANWQEQTYVVKAHFPLDIFHSEIRCDIQYGNVSRPTCKNTSWDIARFEVCAHKWVDISESDYGAALINDCKYGHSATDDEIALTLLKTSHYPDETGDVGEHRFTYSLYPHTGDWRVGNVIEEAYKMNVSAACIDGARAKDTDSLIQIKGRGIVTEAVKHSEDETAIVVRMYECLGGRRQIQLKPGFKFTSAEIVNILEEHVESIPVSGDGTVSLQFGPYQIITVKFII